MVRPNGWNPRGERLGAAKLRAAVETTGTLSAIAASYWLGSELLNDYGTLATQCLPTVLDLDRLNSPRPPLLRK